MSTNEAEATSQDAVEQTGAGEAVSQEAQTMTQTIRINQEESSTSYANFCRASGTPEELFLDFGINPRPFAAGETEVKVSNRVVISYYTAKRMIGILTNVVQQHEAGFGVLETDIRKRVQPMPTQTAETTEANN